MQHITGDQLLIRRKAIANRTYTRPDQLEVINQRHNKEQTLSRHQIYGTIIFKQLALQGLINIDNVSESTRLHLVLSKVRSGIEILQTGRGIGLKERNGL